MGRLTPPPGAPTLAPLTPAHLGGVLAVQAAAHGAALLQVPAVLASKLRAPGWARCWRAPASTR